MDKIIVGILAIFIAIVLVVYEMIDTIRCIFDFHKWKESGDGMERICERCGISLANCHKRQRRHYWFRFLAFLRSILGPMKEKLIGPTEKYTERGRKDPFYQPTNWEKFGRFIWRLFKILIFVISLIFLFIS